MTGQKQQNANESIYIPLSQDELAYLMEKLNIAALPGFTIPEDYTHAHGEAARRSLLARLLLAIGDDGSEDVAEPLQTLLIASAQPQQVIGITTTLEDMATENWFYILPGFVVYQRSPIEGIQQIVAMRDGGQISVTIAALLGMLDDTQPKGKTVQIEKIVYDQIRAAARVNNIHGAYAIANGYDKTTMAALIEPDLFSTVTLIEAVDGEPQAVDARLILRHDDSYWLVTTDQSGTQMQLKPAGNSEILIQIAGLISVNP